jgi:hypothetical protein
VRLEILDYVVLIVRDPDGNLIELAQDLGRA